MRTFEVGLKAFFFVLCYGHKPMGVRVKYGNLNEHNPHGFIVLNILSLDVGIFWEGLVYMENGEGVSLLAGSEVSKHSCNSQYTLCLVVMDIDVHS